MLHEKEDESILVIAPLIFFGMMAIKRFLMKYKCILDWSCKQRIKDIKKFSDLLDQSKHKFGNLNPFFLVPSLWEASLVENVGHIFIKNHALNTL